MDSTYDESRRAISDFRAQTPISSEILEYFIKNPQDVRKLATWFSFGTLFKSSRIENYELFIYEHRELFSRSILENNKHAHPYKEAPIESPHATPDDIYEYRAYNISFDLRNGPYEGKMKIVEEMEKILDIIAQEYVCPLNADKTLTGGYSVDAYTQNRYTINLNNPRYLYSYLASCDWVEDPIPIVFYTYYSVGPKELDLKYLSDNLHHRYNYITVSSDAGMYLNLTHNTDIGTGSEADKIMKMFIEIDTPLKVSIAYNVSVLHMGRYEIVKY